MTLDHREPDRLVVDLGSTATTTITRGAYVRLRKHLGLIEKQPDLLSFSAQTVRPHDDFLEHLQIDTRGVVPNPSSQYDFLLTRQDGYEVFYDEYGIGFRRPLEGGLYYDLFSHPLKDKSADEALNWTLPKADEASRFRGLREKCLSLRESGYPTILSYSIGRGILHEGTALFGYEDYFCRLYLEPTLIRRMNERFLQCRIDFYGSLLDEAGDLIDVILEADDLGTQRGPLISPELYRTTIKPFQAELFSEIKKRAPHTRILYHTCGSVVDFIPDLIEIGVDILNPVQVSAHGMDAEALKRTFGNDICFWGGGIDTQRVLPYGSTEEIKEEVRRYLDVWLPGGGYVFSAVHNIQDDVPPENIAALFEAIDEFR